MQNQFCYEYRQYHAYFDPLSLLIMFSRPILNCIYISIFLMTVAVLKPYLHNMKYMYLHEESMKSFQIFCM